MTSQGARPANALSEPLGEHLGRILAEGAVGAWGAVVATWLASASGLSLVQAVEQRQRAGAVVYPHRVLRALELTPLPSVRVVILGQDPYHGPGQAQGLAFSVGADTPRPPSLRHILQEVERDTGALNPAVRSGSLEAWAEQGVLLLNTSLTVEDASPGSHARWGWTSLTDALLQAVARQALAQGRPVAALLWGAHAQARRPAFEAVERAGLGLVLQANHPSPLSARRPPQPFLGCGHFSRARDFLAGLEPGRPPLSW